MVQSADNPEPIAAHGGREPRTLKLTLAYDGTDYVGWQRQAEGVSIQGLIEAALSAIEGRHVTVTGAGRTDAGVHALGQVASTVFMHDLDTTRLRRALNAMLPPEVRILAVEEAPAAFHARRGACAKTYRYCIASGEMVSPFERRYVWHVRQALNPDAMAAAARLLEGRHDFAGFQAAGSAIATTVRTVFSSTLRPAGDEDQFWPPGARAAGRDAPSRLLLVYDVTGDGFLRHMVRTIVGTLVDIGSGRRDPHAIDTVLAARQRQAAGPTAPASGLCLVRVAFDPQALGLRVDAGAL
ncbi:MAG: tRNA pseudouridine(38-40) synthase TruA [Acidobacteria bacterium]|nr:tRNA pseudouridine(38-40) synthase TruA [Acidobacteriota bacterium]